MASGGGCTSSPRATLADGHSELLDGLILHAALVTLAAGVIKSCIQDTVLEYLSRNNVNG